MAKKLQIWFSPKLGENKGKWEIFRKGQPTGEIVTSKLIQKILTEDQYKQFLQGDEFFHVKGETFRTRKHKPRKTLFTGKPKGLN